jgi:hypothetical protein
MALLKAFFEPRLRGFPRQRLGPAFTPGGRNGATNASPVYGASRSSALALSPNAGG